ncbi:MAG: LamG domain-containing protein [Planctomycetes bacterium]|nr:LamG domain-containing protein [Planctomycetota bacterium]
MVRFATRAAAVLVILLGRGVAAFQDCRPDPSLVAHWNFDKGRGARVQDGSGNRHHGVVLGGSSVPGVRGGALRFDGRHGEVAIQMTRRLMNATAGPHTLSAWLELDRSPGTYKFVVDGSDTGPGGDQRGIRLQPDGRVVFKWVTTRGSFTAVACRRFPSRGWHHVAGVFDGEQGRLYVDGRVVACAEGNGAGTPISMFKLGDVSSGGTGDGTLCGSMDEVKVWDRALEPHEIRELVTAR